MDQTRTTLGDIDIAVKLERKEQDPEKHLKMNLDLADEDGRGYEIYSFKVFYGWYKVLKYLRNKSREISSHTTEDNVLKTGIPIKVVFPHEDC